MQAQAQFEECIAKFFHYKRVWHKVIETWSSMTYVQANNETKTILECVEHLPALYTQGVDVSIETKLNSDASLLTITLICSSLFSERHKI
jgi:quinol monooxygenase YgiN